MAKLISLQEFQRKARNKGRSKRPKTYFDRRELNQLMNLYSRRVMRGEWRDYAIDHGAGLAVFSIFRNSSERPIFSITKSQSDGKARAEYRLFDGPRQVEQASELGELIAAIERKPRLIWSTS